MADLVQTIETTGGAAVPVVATHQLEEKALPPSASGQTGLLTTGDMEACHMTLMGLMVGHMTTLDLIQPIRDMDKQCHPCQQGKTFT